MSQLSSFTLSHVIDFDFKCLKVGITISEDWVISISSPWSIKCIGVSHITTHVLIRIVWHIQVVPVSKSWAIRRVAINSMSHSILNWILSFKVHWKKIWLVVSLIVLALVPISLSESTKYFIFIGFDDSDGPAYIVTFLVKLCTLKPVYWRSVQSCHLRLVYVPHEEMSDKHSVF